MQHHAEHLGEGADAGGRFARRQRGVHVLGMDLGVADAEEVRHAERADDFRVAAAALGHHLAFGAALGEFVGRLLALGVRVERQQDDDEAADDRHPAEPRMDDETADEEDRHEGHVEHGCRAEARQEPADLVEIADRLQAFGRFGALERHRGDEVEHAAGQELVEAGADSGQHLAAQRVEAALQQVGRQHDQRQADQRRDAAARQHAVVKLEHVDRPGQGQDIHDRRKNRHAAE